MDSLTGVGDRATFLEHEVEPGLSNRALFVVTGQWEFNLQTHEGRGATYVCSRTQLEQLARTIVSRIH